MAVETRTGAGGSRGENVQTGAARARAADAGSTDAGASRPPGVDAAACGAPGGAETSNAAALRGAPEVGEVEEDPGSSEDVTMLTPEGDLPEGEQQRRNAEAALARERERALLEEERTLALLREME